MIKIYGMKTCPDCMAVDKQAEGNNRYEVIDIGDHVKYLKEFLYLRDNSPAFAEAREKGYIGIPCFVLEDGTVTLDPEKALDPCRNSNIFSILFVLQIEQRQ